MQVVELEIGKIVPYQNNPRTHSDEQVNRIASSIAEFGFNQPIVIDENNIVLVGHGRLEAAKKINRKTAPTIQLKSLTEAQKKAYRIIDNKLQNDSTWQIEDLNIELSSLEDLGFDLELYGLDDLKLEVEPEVKDDEFEAPDEIQTDIKLGDVIELGPHRVMCGDSTSAENVSELLGGSKPILMVTDPPYGVEYNADWRNSALRSDGLRPNGRAIGKVTNDDRRDWQEAYKLFPVEVAYVWHASWHAKEVQISLEESGFEIICQIIWAKNNFAIGRGDYHWKHEPCWYAVKKGKPHNYYGDRSQTTLWEINKPQKSETGHSTQKPIECMARPIINNSKQKDVVVDPFLGSGTTLIAADQLGRICYGIEIEPRYCQVIVDRYRKHCLANNKEPVIKINGVTV